MFRFVKATCIQLTTCIYLVMKRQCQLHYFTARNTIQILREGPNSFFDLQCRYKTA